ncbi:MAG: hypothetical protein K0Q87_3089 [Neobacillus sp.]|jgi:HlyD family secretion protein|nr:hypothetical protein [Neobacillus sp.]
MKKWIISIVVVMIVIGAGATANSYYTNKNTTTTTQTVQTQTATAETENVEVAVSGTGNISSINKETLTAEGNATVDEVLVAVGDTVAEGDELVTFVDDTLDPIVAPFSGEITSLNVEADGKVQMGTELVGVTDYSNLEMIVNVDELDIAKVKVGQTAKVDVSALTDKEFTGTVTSVAKEANDDSSSTVAKYKVKITINEPTDIKVGMTAEATITTEKKENVVTVPVAAIQKQDDKYYVLVPSKDQTTTTSTDQSNGATTTTNNSKSTSDNSTTATIKTTQKTVEIGLQNNTVVEITSGLAEGDEVVLPSLNSNSSNSNQNSNNMFQGGFPGGDMGQGGPPSGMPQGTNGGSQSGSQGGN